MPSQTTLTGASGEYYVMCQLLRRGYIAALAPVGVPNADIIVTDDIGDRLCAIQVKTRHDKGGDGGWHMKKKHEEIISSSLFYCFLDFGDSLAAVPKCWIVPSNEVARVLKQSHANWLAKPGKNGKEHNESDMRRFLPDYTKLGMSTEYGNGWLNKFLEAWDTLKTN